MSGGSTPQLPMERGWSAATSYVDISRDQIYWPTVTLAMSRPCPIKINHIQIIAEGEVRNRCLHYVQLHHKLTIALLHIFNLQIIANNSKERETSKWSCGGAAVPAQRYSSRLWPGHYKLQTLLSASGHTATAASSCSVPGPVCRPAGTRVCTLRYIANLVQPPVSSHINTHQPNVNEPDL